MVKMVKGHEEYCESMIKQSYVIHLCQLGGLDDRRDSYEGDAIIYHWRKSSRTIHNNE